MVVEVVAPQSAETSTRVLIDSPDSEQKATEQKDGPGSIEEVAPKDDVAEGEEAE